MPALIDLTGKQFGKLTVLKQDEKYKIENQIKRKSETYWLCQCLCGNLITVSRTYLKNNKEPKCKQCQNALRVKDLTGSKFGDITVLGRDLDAEKQSSRKDALWKCKCKCGKEWTSFAFSLKNRNNCGRCLERETIGKKFGNLTVVAFAGLKRGPGEYNTASWFLCKCKCGKEFEVEYSHLTSGHTQSCGCERESFGEKEITKLLLDNNISFIREYSFSDLKGSNGGLLRFDFAIFENNEIVRLVEFDGKQHEGPKKYFGGEKEYAKLKHHDRLKNQYAQRKNIPLVRLPFRLKGKITLKDIFEDFYLVKEKM